MQFRKSIIVLMTALSLTACNSDKDTAPESQSSNKPVSAESAIVTPANSLNEIYQDATKALFQQRALSATLYGLSHQEVGEDYSQKMEDFSTVSEQKLRKSLAEISKKIANYPSSSLKVEEQENQKVMASITRYYAGHPDFNIGYIDVWMGLSPFVVNQINGPLIDIPRTMQNDQAVTNMAEAKAYLARLGKFDQMIASISQKLDADVAQGWIAPKVTLKGAAKFLNGFTQSEPKAHMLVSAFKDKLAKVDSIDKEEKEALVAEAVRIIEEIVYPAYQMIAEQTEALIDKARDESGVWAQPEGEKYYQEAILQLGDSTMSADEIHEIGLSEVKRISSEMDAILSANGYQSGTVGERMVKLGEESRFLYPDTHAGRKQLLQDLNGYIDDISQKMQPLFKTKPPYAVEVRAFPVEVQDGAPGGQYTSPSVDGSKPGVYWINLRDMKANPKFGLKSLTYHEANPGHHWQVALNLAQDSLPFLQRIAPYNAYVEGWALYSEQVAYEIGMYENDPFGNLGRLQAELFRAVRLVVDTGLHHKRWTREQAIEYMSKQTGSAESDVVAEIERYMTWPGQALGYKLGMLKILSLREEAKKALGDKFDLAAFHDLILLGGAVPMTVLEAKVKRWVSEQLAQ